MFFKLFLILTLLMPPSIKADGTSVFREVPSAFHIIQLSGFTHYGKLEKTDSLWVILHDDDGNSVQSAFQTLRQRRESYHFYISRSGRTYQLVDTKWQAKHAGLTRYADMDHWNEFSIGICLENNEEEEYTEIQYIRLNQLLIHLKKHYPTLSKSHIVSHAMVAWPRGRKNDVTSLFRWDKILPLDKAIQGR